MSIERKSNTAWDGLSGSQVVDSPYEHQGPPAWLGGFFMVCLLIIAIGGGFLIAKAYQEVDRLYVHKTNIDRSMNASAQ